MLINNDTIIKDDSELIRNKSIDVSLPISNEDRQLLLDMLKYVDDSTNKELAEENNLRPAVGISAIQIGIPKKMTAIILKNENDEKIHEYALVNPKIVSHSIEKSYLAIGEGCLSVTEDHDGYIYRHARVKVKGFDILQNKEIEIKADGYLAIVLQHELDHFKGILFYDHINKNNPKYEDPEAIRIE